MEQHDAHSRPILSSFEGLSSKVSRLIKEEESVYDWYPSLLTRRYVYALTLPPGSNTPLSLIRSPFCLFLLISLFREHPLLGTLGLMTAWSKLKMKMKMNIVVQEGEEWSSSSPHCSFILVSELLGA